MSDPSWNAGYNKYQKHGNFVMHERIMVHRIRELPDVGPAIGRQLKEQGYQEICTMPEPRWNAGQDKNRKHRDFVQGSITSRPVEVIPGVGPAIGRQLKEHGYQEADAVLGKYVAMKKDKERFQEWLMEKGNANRRQAADAGDCMEAWVKRNL